MSGAPGQAVAGPPQHRLERRARRTRSPKQSGGLRNRAVWVLADSALSSLTNAGLTIGLARVVSQHQFGAFAVSFTFFSLIQSISVALNNQVVVIAYADQSSEKQHRIASSAAAGSVMVGAATGSAMVVAGLFTGHLVGYSLIAMGVVMPALMVQDHWRSTFIAFGEPRNAFLLDLAWGVIWGAGFVVLIRFGVRAAALYIVVWGAGALLSAVYGASIAHTWMTFKGIGRWFIDHRDVTLPSLANTLATIGFAQLAFLLIAAIGSIDDVGALRGLQTLLGPLNIVGYAIISFATPELIRRRPGPRGLVLAGVAMGAVMLTVAASWGAILLLLPDAAGRSLLGGTWPVARRAMPGLVVYQCSINSVIGVSAVLRSLNRVRSVFYLSAMLGPLILIGATVGEVYDGARGASIGFAVAGLLVIPPSVVSLVRSARLGHRELANAHGEERVPTA